MCSAVIKTVFKVEIKQDIQYCLSLILFSLLKRLPLSRSDLSSFIMSLLVWSGRELGWIVYVLFSMLYFCVWPGMVLNQRQVSIVVSD